MESYTPFFIFLGVMILFAFASYIWHRKHSSNHNYGGQTKDVPRQYKMSEPTMPSKVSNLPKARVSTIEEQEAKNRHLNTLIESLAPLSKNQIWDLEDIKNNVEEYLNDDDVQYIAKQLSTSLFSTSVWDLHEKIKNCQLTNDQIIKILESGTDNIIDTFMEYHSKSTTWTMSGFLLDKIISKNPLWILRFTNYSKDVLKTIIDKLSVYELLGYRIKANHDDEEIQDSFTDFKQELEIDFYESVDDNIIYYLNKNYPTEIDLRKIAFTKLVSDSPNMICIINSVNDLSEDEIKQIIARNYSQEIDALFYSFDSAVVASCFPASYAVKVALQLVECDYEDQLKDNFDFSDISIDDYKIIIENLSADELLGYDNRGDGNYDIIKLFEDNSMGDENLRKIAFDKMMQSSYFKDAIARWDSVSDEEIKVIMERNIEDEINALFGRDDSEDIICNLPEETAIKIRLQLIYADSSETIENNYQFKDEDAFIKVIDELPAKELLGFKTDPNDPDSFYNDAEYDIIKMIEDEMSDNEKLRKLAFAKICEIDDMSAAIARWDSVADEEIKVIMERNIEDEINALFERDNSEDMISNLPEEVAIKIRLQLIYADSSETVENYYQFSDENAFIKVINELPAKELLGFKTDPNDLDSFLNDADYDIIKLIEDEMQDNEDLRKLAFAKICESNDISAAIARWDSVTEDEVKIIMERKIENEIEALFNRDDSEDIVCSLPEETAIKIRLQLIYADSSETIENNYQFKDEDAFIKVIDELPAKELLGFKVDPNDPDSFYNDAEYDIIKLIEDEMQDNEKLRKLAFAKICESNDISAAIERWDNVTEEEVEKIIERGVSGEIDALMERDDADTSNLPDNFIIKKYLLDDEYSIRDEYSNRIDDQDFRQKVERMVKILSSKKLSAKDKEANVEDLSDDIIIKAELQLFDLDECSFDSDDISSEFTDRMNNSIFKQKVEDIISQLS